MSLAERFRECSLSVRDDLDQTLLSLSNCQQSGSDLSIQEYDLKQHILYELPQTGKAVVAPLDSSKIGKNKIAEFVEKNKMVIGAGALILLYYVSKKRGK